MLFRFKPSLFILIATCVLLTKVNGQILVSEVLDGEFALGPKNVLGHTHQLSGYYIRRCEVLKDSLDARISAEEIKTANLNAKGKLKKTERQELARSKKITSIATQEKEILDSLIKVWQKEFAAQNLIQRIAQVVESGECVEINSVKGIVHSKDFSIRTSSISSLTDFKEVISATKGDSSTVWRRMRNTDCLSPNPDDCLVWCLTTLPPEITIEDMQGNEYKEEHCPPGFTFEDRTSTCIRRRTLEEVAGLKPVLFIRSDSLGLISNIDSWKVVSCHD